MTHVRALITLITVQHVPKSGITMANILLSIQVRTPGGNEGFIPALCCILPAPDRNAATTIER